VFLWDGYDQIYDGRGTDVSASISDGYWLLQMASASGSTTTYEVRVYVD